MVLQGRAGRTLEWWAWRAVTMMMQSEDRVSGGRLGCKASTVLTVMWALVWLSGSGSERSRRCGSRVDELNYLILTGEKNTWRGLR